MTRRRIIFVLVVVLIIATVLLYRTFASSPRGATPGTSTPSVTGTEPHWGVQAKSSGCLAHAGLADAACTPGALLATGTKGAICKSGYAGSVRNVPTSEKNQVYR